MIDEMKKHAGIITGADFRKLAIHLRDGRVVQYISGSTKFVDLIGQETTANPAEISKVEWLRDNETFQEYVNRTKPEPVTSTPVADAPSTVVQESLASVEGAKPITDK